MPRIFSQRGATPILLLLVVIALVAFVVSSSTLSFKKGLFGSLYPKDISRASGIVDLSLTPSQVTVAPDSTFTVDIRIDAKTEPVTAAQLAIRWDPALLTATGITKGTFFKGEFAPPALGSGGALYTLNLGISCTSPLDPNTCSPNPIPTGQGILATITFKALTNTTPPAVVTFDANQTLVTSINSADNVVGNLSPMSVIISTNPLSTPSPLPLSTPVPTPVADPKPSPSDNIPPTVSITSPANGATVVKNTNMTISANASDNIGVTRVEFYIDGGLKCKDVSAPYVCVAKIGGKSGAKHTIQAKSFDAVGNNSSSSISLTVK